MIPKSTMYAAVDGSNIIQAKGSAREMRALVKRHKGWYVGNSPTSKVGDTFGRTSAPIVVEPAVGGDTTGVAADIITDALMGREK